MLLYKTLKKETHKRAKVIGGCKHPGSTPQPQSVSWTFLLHPCHSSDPWIYGGFVACCIRCGPALGRGPWHGAETPGVCAHCCRGARLGGCGHGAGHSGPRVRSLPSAPRRQSLDCPGFPSQTSPAGRGPDPSHGGGCDAERTRKIGAGTS